MKGQYEQQCNEAALKLLGVPVLKNLNTKQFPVIKKWMEDDYQVVLSFPDETEYILDEIIESSVNESRKKLKNPEPGISVSKFRNLLIKKIFYQIKA